MRGTWWWVVVAMLWAVPVAAQRKPGTPADPALEQQFRADLARVSPAAAEAFAQGTAARDAGRPDDALAAYRRAIELAPRVDHPHRRACWALGALGRVDEAVVECETALQLALLVRRWPSVSRFTGVLSGPLHTTESFRRIITSRTGRRDGISARPSSSLLAGAMSWAGTR
jgi:hypothetical protein